MIHADGMDLGFYLSEIGACLAGTDVVDQSNYKPDGLSEANHSIDKFDVALAIARDIVKG